MGFALPITLAHTGVITEMAGIMSIAGGALVYGTSEFKRRDDALGWRKEGAAHLLATLQLC